jgi:hypothetical protein
MIVLAVMPLLDVPSLSLYLALILTNSTSSLAETPSITDDRFWIFQKTNLAFCLARPYAHGNLDMVMAATPDESHRCFHAVVPSSDRLAKAPAAM